MSYLGKLCALAITAVMGLIGSGGGVSLAGESYTFLAQGAAWTPDVQARYYSLDQGSRLVPLKWARALRTGGGAPFMADALSRYGFLPMQNSSSDLPIGFSVAGPPGSEAVGLTCAACHTRKIEAEGKTYIVDGGPSFIDLQTFLADLDAAVERVMTDETAFTMFAEAVLGDSYNVAAAATLKEEVKRWHHPFKILVRKSLPQKPWGVGRADAVGMIFNRLTGVSIGEGSDGVILDNIHTADAPVRYPFLWNIGNQNRTQWGGFARNRNEADALVRNVGQVLGVFADFRPTKTPTGVDYLTGNSVPPLNLFSLESYVRMIGAPRWPWGLNEALASEGELIFQRECSQCHGASGTPPWNTPVLSVGTDIRYLQRLSREAETGVLVGQQIDPSVGEIPLPLQGPLGERDAALKILAIAASNTLIQFRNGAPRIMSANPNPNVPGAGVAFDEALRDQSNIIKFEKSGYEARVLEGVWAAAPYLHNGSVPTLTELLKPADQRKAVFKVGSAYDTVAVGLAEEQPGLHSVMMASACSDRESGDSRCGHEHGTTLTEAEKRALLEYLKKL